MTGRIGSASDGQRRVAPANARYRGTNQSGLRAANERLVLSLIRLHGQLSKGQIADITGLTAQTASVIVRSLEADGLLLRGAPVRGRIGQPSIPMLLDPTGALFLGLQLRESGAVLAMVDFLGHQHAERREGHLPPVPATDDAVLDALDSMVSDLTPGQAARLQGVGVAMAAPMLAGIGEAGLDRMADNMQARLGLPVYIQDEAIAACSAELVHGLGAGLSDILFLHVGETLGGGFVRNGRLQFAEDPSSPDIGRMFVPAEDGRLVRLAAIEVPPDRATLAGVIVAGLAQAIACAIQAVSATMTLDAVILNGRLSTAVRRDLVHRVRGQLRSMDPTQPWPTIQEGMSQPVSVAQGAACIPLLNRYATETRTNLPRLI